VCRINNYKLDTAIHNTSCDTIYHTLPQKKQLAKDINNVKVFKQKMTNDKKMKKQFDKLNSQFGL